MSINPEGFFYLCMHIIKDMKKDKFSPALPPARLINVGNQSLAWINLNTGNNWLNTGDTVPMTKLWRCRNLKVFERTKKYVIIQTLWVFDLPPMSVAGLRKQGFAVHKARNTNASFIKRPLGASVRIIEPTLFGLSTILKHMFFV